jgi:hypothetical protein
MEEGNTNVMDFTCTNRHIFSVTLDLPMRLDDFILITKIIRCPLCDCPNKDIFLFQPY